MEIPSLTSGSQFVKGPECSDKFLIDFYCWRKLHVCYTTQTGFAGGHGVSASWVLMKGERLEEGSSSEWHFVSQQRGSPRWNSFIAPGIEGCQEAAELQNHMQHTLDGLHSSQREEKSRLSAQVAGQIWCRGVLPLLSVFPVSTCRICSNFQADFHQEGRWAGEKSGVKAIQK